jgi:hypothetical protein
VKQKIKGKNYAVFCFAGKRKLFLSIYDVIVKNFFYKRSTNHYYHPPASHPLPAAPPRAAAAKDTFGWGTPRPFTTRQRQHTPVS